MRIITEKLIHSFENHLLNEEKSNATVKKYIHDIRLFKKWLNGRSANKKTALQYKALLAQKYKPTSVNSAISSLNSFFAYHEWYDCKVRTLKIQKCIFAPKERVLTKHEYERLVETALRKKNKRLCLLMQAICSTGIRVSELSCITVQAVEDGTSTISSKGKIRRLFLPKPLRRSLKQYIKEQKITSGPVFVTSSGRPLDRSNIWSEMKKLCSKAGVCKDKVFPHNLRHLFARTYYSMHKDIVRLADILGHSSINTTRIYTVENGEVHMRQIEKLGLLRC
ncbi:MAG: integrase [Ruminococcaceae bacterium]|nr:integrase [Oscillospiraceae bacterium]